jgi:hypothetical protein
MVTLPSDSGSHSAAVLRPTTVGALDPHALTRRTLVTQTDHTDVRNVMPDLREVTCPASSPFLRIPNANSLPAFVKAGFASRIPGEAGEDFVRGSVCACVGR